MIPAQCLWFRIFGVQQFIDIYRELLLEIHSANPTQRFREIYITGSLWRHHTSKGHNRVNYRPQPGS